MEGNTMPQGALETLLDAFADLVADKLLERMGRQEPEPLPDNATFTVKEAAEYIGISEASIRRWGKQGQFPIVHHGSRVVIYKRDLDKWLAEGGTQR